MGSVLSSHCNSRQQNITEVLQSDLAITNPDIDALQQYVNKAKFYTSDPQKTSILALQFLDTQMRNENDLKSQHDRRDAVSRINFLKKGMSAMSQRYYY